MPETFVEEGYYDDWPPTTGAYDAKQEMTRPPTDEEMANPVTAMVRRQCTYCLPGSGPNLLCGMHAPRSACANISDSCVFGVRRLPVSSSMPRMAGSTR